MASPRTDTLTAGAGQTVFPYTFWVPNDGTLNIRVWQITFIGGGVAELVEGAGAGKFTVSDRGNQSGGNVTLGTAAAVNDTIVIESAIGIGTFTLFTQPGDFSANALNDEFQRRRESMLDLERNGVTRSPHLPAVADDTINMELPVPVLNAAIGWTSATQVGNLSALTLTGDINAANITGTGILTMGSGAEAITNAAGKTLLAAIEQGGAAVGEHLEWSGSVWAPSAAGVVGGAGSAGTITKWINATTIGDSQLTDDGSIVTLTHATLPKLVITESDQVADEKSWQLSVSNGDLFIGPIPDAGGIGVGGLQIQRGTADVVAAYFFSNAPVALSGVRAGPALVDLAWSPIRLDSGLYEEANDHVAIATSGVKTWEITAAALNKITGTFEVTGASTLTGVITAGSGSTVLTTAAGLLRHQAIDPAIAGSGLSVASGVLSVNWAAPGTIGSGTPNTGAFTTLSTTGLATLESATITNSLGVGITPAVPLHVEQTAAGEVARFESTGVGGSVGVNLKTDDQEWQTAVSASGDYRIFDVTASSTPVVKIQAGALINSLIIQVDGSAVLGGDLVFDSATGKGLYYGHMYGDNVAITVTIAATATFVEVGGTLTAGKLNNVIFQNGNELKPSVEGHYMVLWQMSVETTTANDEVEGSVMINGVKSATASAHRVVAANKPGSFSGVTVLDLAANDIVSLCVANNTAIRDILVNHANCLLVPVGGS